MSLNRDHYEGSQFDLTRGLAAGPYGDPQRFDGTTADGMDLNELLSGMLIKGLLVEHVYCMLCVSMLSDVL